MYTISSVGKITALYTGKSKMSLLMAALAVFVLYTNLCRCSKKYVFLKLFRVVVTEKSKKKRKKSVNPWN